jgi:DNA-directed RNA polymerase subunit RPC12/RpoP
MNEGEFMGDSYYCPDCSHKLEAMSGCASVSYFCNKCKRLISRQRILNEDQIVRKVVKVVIEQLEKI